MFDEMKNVSTFDGTDWIDKISESINEKLNEIESERLEVYFDCSGTDDLSLTSNEKYKLRYNFRDLEVGMAGAFIATGDNAGAMTISIDDHAPLPFKDSRGLDFEAGEIKSGRKYAFFYTGTEFRLYDLVSATETKRGVVEVATQTEVENGAGDAERESHTVVTPETLEGRRAHEGNHGLVEIATQGEVEAGTGTPDRGAPLVVTIQTLDERKAHEGNHGLVEIATQDEVNTGGTSSDRGGELAVTAEKLDARKATDTNHGLVEIATQQEVEDGTGTGDRGAEVVVTPETLEGRRAHEGNHGLVEIATQDEVEAGTGTPDRGAPLVVTIQTLDERKAHEGNHGLVEIATQEEVNTGGTLSDRGGELAVTAEKLDARKATDTNHGLVEIATQQEVEDGTGTGDRGAEVVVTPATLEGRRAHEANHGLVEIATQAEVEAGTGTPDRGAPLVVTIQTLDERKAHEGNHGLVEIATQEEVNTGGTLSDRGGELAVTAEKLDARKATDTNHGLVEIATQQEVEDGTGTGDRGAEVVVTPETLEGRRAHETNHGLVEIATQAEVEAGTGTPDRGAPLAVTVETLHGRRAHEGNHGLIEIATQGEMDAGTDDERAVTPLKITVKLENTTITGGEGIRGAGTLNDNIVLDVDLAPNPGLMIEGDKLKAIIIDNLTSTDAYASLSANQGKLLKDQIDSIMTALIFRGAYAGNSGALPTPTEKNEYWIINTAGGTLTEGETSIAVEVGDWIIHDGTTWHHIDLSNAPTLAERVVYDNSSSDLAATDVSSALDEASARFQTVEGEIDTLEAEVGDVSTLATTAGDTVSAINEVHSERDALQGLHDGLRSEFDVLEGEHDALRGEHDTLRSEFDVVDGEVGDTSTLATTSKEVVGALNEVHSEVDAIEVRVAAAENNISSNDTDISALDGRMTAAESEIDTLELEVGDVLTLATTGGDTVSAINEVHSEVDAIEARVAAAEGNISSNDTDISALDGRMTTAESEIDTLELEVGDVSTLATTGGDTVSAINEVHSEVDSIEARVAAAEGNIGTNDTEIFDLTTRMTAAEGSIVSNDGDITALQSGKQDALTATSDIAVRNIDIYGDILPDTTLTRNLGSETNWFADAWIESLHLGMNTLWLGDTPIMGTDGVTINIEADTHQHIVMKTKGVGTSKVISESGVELSTSGMNADVILQALGTGSRVVIGSNTGIVYNSPETAFNGNLDVTGHTTFDTATFTGNVVFNGDQTIVDSIVVAVEDNIILLNKGEVGSGVTAGQSGLRVARGELVDQLLVWDEATDRWSAGKVEGPFVSFTLETETQALQGEIDALETAVGDVNTLATTAGEVVAAINEVRTLADGNHSHGTGDIGYVNDTLTAGSYTAFPLDRDYYLCDCSAGDVIIETLDAGAQPGKTVVFKKTDSSSNRVILRNAANGGFVEAPFTSDVEIVDQYGSVEYMNI